CRPPSSALQRYEVGIETAAEVEWYLASKLERDQFDRNGRRGPRRGAHRIRLTLDHRIIRPPKDRDAFEGDSQERRAVGWDSPWCDGGARDGDEEIGSCWNNV